MSRAGSPARSMDGASTRSPPSSPPTGKHRATARLWPRSPEDADRLLDFFLLEKAFYEIEYELAHRPDWLRVPLAGTWRILTRSEGTPQ